MGVISCRCLDAAAFVPNDGGHKSEVCLNKSVPSAFLRAGFVFPASIRLHLRLLFASAILLLGSAPSIPDLVLPGPDQDSVGVDLRPHTTSVQPRSRINNSSGDLNFVFHDVTLDASRLFRVRWKPHVLFADGFHPYLRFGRDDGPLRLRRPTLPPLVRPLHPGSKRPCRLWNPRPTAISSVTPLMTSSLGRVSSTAPFLRCVFVRVSGFLYRGVVVFWPSSEGLHVMWAA